MVRRLHELFHRYDPLIAAWMRHWGHDLLRWSLAVIFIWFGILKPFGLSEANALIEATVYWAVDPAWFIPVLGVWEVAIGVCLLFRPLIRLAILLLAGQMGGTFLSLVLVPEATWVEAPWWPTLAGQYVIKNLLIISGAIVVGGTVRTGRRKA
ncbi:hypothetical protein ACERK3_04745 [Phycisphaerales bacterium AB-hyl4]|uniref:Uncharacterized protein n=1 Tax=Natronomicrosphaera hydrolytica TaxID=3242702 RepID=A0ABV4U434_9BACT